MGNMGKTYIHYGFSELDKARIKPIQNQPYFCKPIGGLWASPVDAKYGWKQWCTDEDFMDCREECSCRFTLRPDANVLTLTTKDDLESVPRAKQIVPIRSTFVCPDFEKLLADGVDAVELDLSGGDYQLYYPLYGWDCDSIVILNPDIIVCMENNT